MPTLNWIGKDAVVNHHKEVPFHLLKCDEKLSVVPKTSEVLETSEVSHAGNLLVQGDNLLALKALLPHYAGQVKCIYIDPPYNTGEEGWAYNDKVNSPEINGWLGQVVGRENEDMTRHDKWLCMMYPRLSLLKELLRDDGVLFISIDEFEIANLRLLLNEVFGSDNDMGCLVWKRRSSSAMSGTPLSIDHEYILVFAKDKNKISLYGLGKGIENYPNKDEKGFYASTDLTVGMDRNARPGQYYQIVNPRTGKVYEPNPERVWRFFPETMNKVIEAELIIWPDEQDGNMQRPRYKTYFDPDNLKPTPISSWIESTGTNERDIANEEAEYDLSILTTGMNQEGGKLLQKIFGTKAFSYPKPVSLIKSLIRSATRENDLVMDSFAGSGTTGHAVLQMNKEDGGNRRFILVEMDENISKNITAERLKRVSQGYEWKDQKGNKKKEEGLGGGFRFCTLGETLFDSEGQIQKEVTFEDLARHVYFVETGFPLPEGEGRARATQRLRKSEHSPLLGIHNGVAVYLLYNGVLKDKSRAGGNVLTRPLLAELPEHDGAKVIYGNGTLLSENTLRSLGITFRQVPYEIKIS